MLLQHVLQVPRSWLIAHDTDVLDPVSVTSFLSLAQRRHAGEPMAYLMGVREFMGHDFRVTPDVLIPRPDTEVLVETAIAFINQVTHVPVRVLDLGTGSGAIAVSMALTCPQAQVVATDFSLAALEVARQNAQALNAQVEFFYGSWFDALPVEMAAFDLIVSNPPYIHSADLHLAQGDLRFEPATALTDGFDGLQDLHTIISGAGRWLRPGGSLWLEHGWDQAQAVREALVNAGFKRVESLTDLAGIERISGGYL